MEEVVDSPWVPEECFMAVEAGAEALAQAAEAASEASEVEASAVVVLVEVGSTNVVELLNQVYRFILPLLCMRSPGKKPI